mgnify:CR=1 FL=1
MTNRIAHAFLAAALFLPLGGAAPPAPTPKPDPVSAVDGTIRVALDTPAGRIVVALDQRHAPATTANFLRYVDARRFDGINFYRAMQWGSGNGLIQGGITKDARLLYPPVKHEATATTGLTHKQGTISMANFGPGTARSDFFILAGPIPALDSGPGKPGFAAFGQVVEGMEVVTAILAAPVSPTRGEGALKGQMLNPAVTIRTVRRVAR